MMTDEDHATTSQNESTTGDLSGTTLTLLSKLAKRCADGGNIQYYRVAMMAHHDRDRIPAPTFMVALPNYANSASFESRQPFCTTKKWL